MSVISNRYFKAQPTGTTPTDEWVRNPLWLPMPEIATGEQIFYALVAVFPKGFNQVRFRFNVDSGTVNYIFGDGNTTSVASGVFVTHNYNYDDLPSSTEVIDPEYGIYRQALLEIRPNSGNIFNNLFEFRPLATRQLYLDVYCNLPDALDVNSVQSVSALMERFRFKEGGTPTGSLLNIFNQCTRLQVIQIDWDRPTSFGAWAHTKIKNFGNINAVNATGAVVLGTQSRTFSNQIYGDVDYYGTSATPLGNITGINKVGKVTSHNATSANSHFLEWHSLEGHLHFEGPNVTTATLFTRNCNKLTSIYFDAPLCQNINNFAMVCFSMNSIVFADASNIITVDTAAFTNGTQNLSILRLPGMRVSFTVQNTNIDAPEMVDLFNDLADLITLSLPSATIIITSTPAADNLTLAEREIATDKGWAITG
jgi:hypothetical protein